MIALDKLRRTVDDFGNQVRELLDTMEYQISEAAIEADKLLAVWCNEPAAVDLEGIAQLSARLDDLEARIRESLGPATFIWSIREFQNEFGRVDQSQDRRAGVRIESVGDPLTPGQLEALRRIQADYEGALDRPHHILPAIAGRLAAVGLRLRDVRTTAGDYGRIFNIEVAPVEGGN